MTCCCTSSPSGFSMVKYDPPTTSNGEATIGGSAGLMPTPVLSMRTARMLAMGEDRDTGGAGLDRARRLVSLRADWLGDVVAVAGGDMGAGEATKGWVLFGEESVERGRMSCETPCS